MSHQLKLLEHYASIQGEGPRTGTPTQFVRFAGCNMRCDGWPCDTPFAIYPDQWQSQYKKVWSSDLLTDVFSVGDLTGAWNICLTGGEPFIQNHDTLGKFVAECEEAGMTLEVFTNGSIQLPDWVFESNMRVMMDWKLTGSGEGLTGLPERWVNASRLRMCDGIKFVIAEEADLHEAVQLTEQIVKTDTGAQIWAGTAWAHIPEWSLVEFILANQLPWRLNVQVHKMIWESTERGV